MGHGVLSLRGPDGTGMRNLGSFGGEYSEASGINDGGTGGRIGRYGSRRKCFHHRPNGEGMTDLNSLIDLPQGVALTTGGGQ